MAEYYRQRASAGLIISEATQISAQASASTVITQLFVAIAAGKITQGVHTRAGYGGNCGIRAVFHTPACNRADKRRRAIRYQCGNPHPA